jgi:CheY-like chemotaxis protein
MQPKRILVVDDEPTLCTLTARALRECGHEVVAADGIAAYNWPALSRSTWW